MLLKRRRAQASPPCTGALLVLLRFQGSIQAELNPQHGPQELADVETKLEKLKGTLNEVKRNMKLDGSIFQDAKVIGTASLWSPFAE